MQLVSLGLRPGRHGLEPLNLEIAPRLMLGLQPLSLSPLLNLVHRNHLLGTSPKTEVLTELSQTLQVGASSLPKTPDHLWAAGARNPEITVQSFQQCRGRACSIIG